MKSEIVSITKPIKSDLLNLSPEQFIVWQARISSPHNQDNHATGHKLLRYCLTNGHWSVFDMVDVTFEIHTSRAIMAQVLRHSSFKFQEFSQRYAEVMDFDFNDLEMRFKHDEGNRQGSGTVSFKGSWHAQDLVAEQVRGYQDLIKDSIAPESARMILPLCTPTKAYMKGSVRSWITYFWQRRSSHSQKEHRDLANSIFAQFTEHFPLCAKLADEGKMQYVSNEEGSEA
jgi:thymidylate synthase (FAD)